MRKARRLGNIDTRARWRTDRSSCSGRNWAGFEPDRHNAAKLQHSYHISPRVAELLAEREKVHGQATAVAIKRAALTKTWVLDKLIENVDRAHRSRWSPRARGEGWWPIIRLLGPQVC